MKVKCISNFVKDSKKSYDTQINSKYNVLSVAFNYNDFKYVESCRYSDFIIYKIIDRHGTLMPYPSQLFEVVDPVIPPNWIFKKIDNNFAELIPLEWNCDSFWEDYYNGESYAQELVQKQFIT